MYKVRILQIHDDLLCYADEDLEGSYEHLFEAVDENKKINTTNNKLPCDIVKVFSGRRD